jgi:hypothetical protein
MIASSVREKQMNPYKAKEEFEAFVASRTKTLTSLKPNDGISAMFDFYRSVRAEKCHIEDDGDMLLFQWGTYTTLKGERFTYDITRQLIIEGSDDENFWQLGLTFEFPSVSELTSIGNGNRWCSSPDELSSFEGFVVAHPATAAVSSRRDGEVKLTYDCIG